MQLNIIELNKDYWIEYFSNRITTREICYFFLKKNIASVSFTSLTFFALQIPNITNRNIFSQWNKKNE